MKKDNTSESICQQETETTIRELSELISNLQDRDFCYDHILYGLQYHAELAKHTALDVGMSKKKVDDIISNSKKEANEDNAVGPDLCR